MTKNLVSAKLFLMYVCSWAVIIINDFIKSTNIQKNMTAFRNPKLLYFNITRPNETYAYRLS